MKTLALCKATGSLAEYTRDAKDQAETLVVTNRGRPVAALVPLTNVDWETVRVSTNPKFRGIIERSRRRQAREGGISSGEMRRQLGLPARRTTSDTAREEDP